MLKKAREVVCEMINIGCIAPFYLPCFAEYLALPLRDNEHGGHSQRVRRLQIARQVFEHAGLGRIDAVAGKKALIDLRQRFGIEIRSGNIEHVLKMPMDLESLHDRISMLACAVGEDELPPGKSFERGAKRRVCLEWRVVNLVYEFQII